MRPEYDGDNWIFIGYTDGAKVYDDRGREREIVPPEPLPDGVEFGRGKLYWKPADAAEAGG